MPQLDKITFLSQFLWLVSCFTIFYFILAKTYLPKIRRILKVRHSLSSLKSSSNSQQGLDVSQIFGSEEIVKKPSYIKRIKISRAFIKTASSIHSSACGTLPFFFKINNSDYLLYFYWTSMIRIARFSYYSLVSIKPCTAIECQIFRLHTVKLLKLKKMKKKSVYNKYISMA